MFSRKSIKWIDMSNTSVCITKTWWIFFYIVIAKSISHQMDKCSCILILLMKIKAYQLEFQMEKSSVSKTKILYRAIGRKPSAQILSHWNLLRNIVDTGLIIYRRHFKNGKQLMSLSRRRISCLSINQRYITVIL